MVDLGVDFPSRRSDTSGAAITDGNLVSLYNHRNLTLPVRKLEHFIQPFGVFLDIDVLVILISLTGLLRVRSTGFSVNGDLFCHHNLLLGLRFSQQQKAAGLRAQL
jgi:hypothetical protein